MRFEIFLLVLALISCGRHDPRELSAEAPLSSAYQARVGSTCNGSLLSAHVSLPIDVSPKKVENWGRILRSAPTPTGGYVIAWTNTKGSYLTYIDSEGKRTQADTEFLNPNMNWKSSPVPLSDGYAILAIRDVWQSQVTTGSLSLVKVNFSGQVVLDRIIDGNCTRQTGFCREMDLSFGGQLVWLGSRFVAYYSFFDYGEGTTLHHQSDTMRSLNADGSPFIGDDSIEGGQIGVCSHSFNQQMAFNGSKLLGTACLSDAYPLRGINGPRGTNFANFVSFCVDHSPGCVISVQNDPIAMRSMGNILPTTEGYWVVFSSREGRESWDLAARFLSNFKQMGPLVWLTHTPTLDESAPRLARYEDGYVVTFRQDEKGKWNTGFSSILRTDRTMLVVGGPEALPIRLSDTTWFDNTYSITSGKRTSAVWVQRNSTNSGMELHRLEACRETEPQPTVTPLPSPSPTVTPSPSPFPTLGPLPSLQPSPMPRPHPDPAPSKAGKIIKTILISVAGLILLLGLLGA